MFQYSRETYVVDGGSTSEKNIADKVLLPCLKYYGISEVSGVFISHADADHMNGIVQWLSEYEHSHVKIGRIILPDLAEEALKQEFGELLALAEEAGVPVTTLRVGDRLQMGKLSIEVLNPSKDYADIEDANAYSQVLLFTYQGQGVLMTGDIGAEQEFAILDSLGALQEVSQKTSINIAVLKAAHHGSKYSSSEEFLRAVQPENIVLSYGVGNSYGHPHSDAVARMQETGAELWYTGRQGAIMVEIGKEVVVQSWCHPD